MILRNEAMCLICNEVLVSKHKHDCRRCTCGNLLIDGGKSYLRRSVLYPEKFLEMMELEVEE